MRTIILAIVLLLLTTSLAMAGTFGLDFNDNSAEGRLSMPLNEDDYGTTMINGRYLYNGDEQTNLGSVAIAFYGEPGNIPGLTLGAGFVGYIGKTHRAYENLNVALGGEAEYMPEALRGVGFGAKLAIAPKVFSFVDSEGLIEWSARIFYAVTPKVHLYLNYQRIEGDYKSVNNVTLDSDLRFGIRAFF